MNRFNRNKIINGAITLVYFQYYYYNGRKRKIKKLVKWIQKSSDL